MADFQVNVVRVDGIEPIEGADRIELAVVGAFRSIVAKGSFKTGDLAVYIPEASVLPDWLIQRMNLVGMLSGSKQNRVKAKKLKGCLSQGLLYPTIYIPTFDCDTGKHGSICHTVSDDGGNHFEVDEGTDVAEFLGIKKFDPAESMTQEQRKKFYGNCVNIYGKTVKYDLENWKKHPNVFAEGEEVVITEKLHGTMCCFAYYPGLNHEDLPYDIFVYSKGLGAGGNVFKWENDGVPATNVYLDAFRSFTNDQNLESTIIGRVWETLVDSWKISPNLPVYLFGEVYGANVQDLAYGESSPKFRAFDVWVGDPQSGSFLSTETKYWLFDAAKVPAVPVLYTGPFSKEKLLELTDGKTTLGQGHIREGVVVTSAVEGYDRKAGRKALKNVSGDYLTRKGETTEFQ